MDEFGTEVLKATTIHKARRHLRAADPVMRAVIDAVGPFTLRLKCDRLGRLRNPSSLDRFWPRTLFTSVYSVEGSP